MTNVRPVLIVDDDPDTREALEILFHLEGFTIATATNGFEAIQQAISSPKPCVILIEDRMPLMSGMDFLAHRERDPRIQGIPVVIATGDPRTASEFKSRGAAVFQKPFDLDGLLGVVREHCA